MPKSGKHLTFENREVVEQGIKDGDSASRIARRLRVAASTVTREAKAHRTHGEAQEGVAAREGVAALRQAGFVPQERDCVPEVLHQVHQLQGLPHEKVRPDLPGLRDEDVP